MTKYEKLVIQLLIMLLNGMVLVVKHDGYPPYKKVDYAEQVDIIISMANKFRSEDKEDV